MRVLSRRVRSLEEASAFKPVTSEVWHQLIWDVGQSWDDLLASYGEDRIAPGDNIMLIQLVDAENGRPAVDLVRERDLPEANAWLAAQEAST